MQKNAPPEPERWIAKKDRAYNKRKKQKLARGGGQGSVPTTETKITSPTAKPEPKLVSPAPKGKLAPKGKAPIPTVAVETPLPKGKLTPKETNPKPTAKTEPISPKQITTSPKSKESAKPTPKEANPKPAAKTEPISPKQSPKGMTPIQKGKEPPQDINEKKRNTSTNHITNPSKTKRSKSYTFIKRRKEKE